MILITQINVHMVYSLSRFHYKLSHYYYLQHTVGLNKPLITSTQTLRFLCTNTNDIIEVTTSSPSSYHKNPTPLWIAFLFHFRIPHRFCSLWLNATCCWIFIIHFVVQKLSYDKNLKFWAELQMSLKYTKKVN